MSRALAIETSGRIGSIALVENGAVLSEKVFPHGLQHAAMIIPIIDDLCRDHATKPTDLEHLYVSAGPGSFTGLRIGITLCKTLAFTTGVRIVAVPTLRVLVENARSDAENVIIVLDAKRDQIFTGRYQREGDGWKEVEGPHLDSLVAMIKRSPRPLHLLGEGIPFHRKFFPSDSSIIETSEESWRARAAAVAKIGAAMAKNDEFADPFALSPIYIRKPEAEEKWDVLHGKAAS
jgi:tRNA threonylcarbamoyladenosine biosynthesis protein TsaB